MKTRLHKQTQKRKPMADDLTLLKKLCYSKAYSLYGPLFFSEKKERLDWELDKVSAISGGAGAFLQMKDFIQKLKIFQKNMDKDISMRYGFRGAAASSLIAYLLEISEMDPFPYYPWTFFAGQKKLYFYLNMSLDLYENMYNWYNNIQIPSFLDIYVCLDISILEWIEKNTGEYYLRDPMDMKNILVYDAEIRKFFENDSLLEADSKLRFLTDFNKKYVPEVYRVLSLIKEYDHVPSSLQELMTLSGFLHSSFYEKKCSHDSCISEFFGDWFFYTTHASVYDYIVANPEDIYENLTWCGCPESDAIILSIKVQRAKQELTVDDWYVVKKYCGRQYADMVCEIEHLYYRSQCMENTIVTAQLMHYINEDYEAFMEAYDHISNKLGICV